MLRRLMIASAVVCCGAAAAMPASAHNNGYAFEARDVRIKQNNTRWLFNRTFPDWGPHTVRCWGLGATRMRNGSRGYVHIRCQIETMNVPDFIWHINASGSEFTTRSWG